MDYSNKLNAQWNALCQVPMMTLSNWPAFFTFAIVDAVAGMAITALPRMSGTGGTIERAAITGFAQVVNFVTWDAIKGAH